MSAHRQNAIPQQGEAQPPKPMQDERFSRPASRWPEILAFALLIILPGTAALLQAKVNASRPTFEPLPAHLDAQMLAQIRLESFRAGLQAGVEQGCGAPRLAAPIAPASAGATTGAAP